MSRSIRSALRLRSIVGMDADSNPEEWPPPEARLQGILWRAEGHLLRAEYGQASRALEEAAGLGEPELVAGLRHLSAAGWRAQNGESRRARRQLAHARRRLARFLPEAREVEVARLLDAIVESADGELA
jgi:hypothetical protein